MDQAKRLSGGTIGRKSCSNTLYGWVGTPTRRQLLWRIRKNKSGMLWSCHWVRGQGYLLSSKVGFSNYHLAYKLIPTMISTFFTRKKTCESMGAKECRGRVSLPRSKDRVLQVRKVDREQVLAPAELPPTSPSLPRPPSHPGTCLGSIFEAAVIFLLCNVHPFQKCNNYYCNHLFSSLNDIPQTCSNP